MPPAFILSQDQTLRELGNRYSTFVDFLKSNYVNQSHKLQYPYWWSLSTRSASPFFRVLMLTKYCSLTTYMWSPKLTISTIYFGTVFGHNILLTTYMWSTKWSPYIWSIAATRTRTGMSRSSQTPQACASTNSAITASLYLRTIDHFVDHFHS
jgi:hypothetical protein